MEETSIATTSWGSCGIESLISALSRLPNGELKLSKMGGLGMQVEAYCRHESFRCLKTL